MKLKRGMIIDVNLDPTLGSETGKIRPCIIVTNNTYNERVLVISVEPITNWSQKKARIKTNYDPLNLDWSHVDCVFLHCH